MAHVGGIGDGSKNVFAEESCATEPQEMSNIFLLLGMAGGGWLEAETRPQRSFFGPQILVAKRDAFKASTTVEAMIAHPIPWVVGACGSLKTACLSKAGWPKAEHAKFMAVDMR